ncbi:MAG: TIGR04053 family radical SAM/SPASM domain-containing protein [Thermoproteota archaeon]
MRGSVDFNRQPILVFWESTKACLLQCKHCRAEAIEKPLPGELTTEEAMDLVDQVASFGNPKPVFVVTGGDPLMRKDLWDIVSYAKGKGLRVALAPSVTPLLNREAIRKMVDAGVDGVSISLDSPYPDVHDGIRGYRGTWKRTVEVLRELVDTGMHIQVNTLIAKPTVEGLPDMVKLLRKLGVEVWEPFYVVPTGRAAREMDLAPHEWEDVGHFLYEASKYGLTVRTVEGPMFRRIALVRMAVEEEGLDPDGVLKPGPLYRRLLSRLRSLAEEPGEPRAQTTGTRDGKGVVFVSHDGKVYPSGFLPLEVGDVRRESLVKIYRESPVLARLRSSKLEGRCGRCEFRDVCGGSRARAYSYTGDPFAEDPACPYEPGSLDKLAKKLGINMKRLSSSLAKLSRGRVMIR